jgi:REP element-mobilizing transposase RayT
MSGRKCKPIQLSFDDARKPSGRGGWRPNAGRPKGRTTVAHEAREEFSPTHPQHVTLRLVPGVPSLRRGDAVKVIWKAIAASQRADFRIIEFNVEPNHMHLIAEAAGARSRARGVQGLEVRIAKSLNRLFGRSGELFEERYHARSLTSPREVRNALRYVLNNARHHAEERGEVLPPEWIDPYSSAIWFDGWSRELVLDRPWKTDLLAMQAPTRKPTVWLLSVGWRRHGLIDTAEVPGVPRRRN